VLHAALFTVRNGCVLAENEHKKENRVVHARIGEKLGHRDREDRKHVTGKLLSGNIDNRKT